ncbi:hypothetical protein MKZ38_009068 [Zalerion maritima]|uniref:Uncharacterized protein n=1 Tax=Zalerion maritima TaxID=339359 RepID=A0AAD5RGU7_9PEZI|nr:hypothetical protein MKZ38_009068 [Zalerion maritima]
MCSTWIYLCFVIRSMCRPLVALWFCRYQSVIQLLGEELSHADMSYVFPKIHSEWLLASLEAGVAALENLDSARQSISQRESRRAKVRWAMLDKKVARRVLQEPSELEAGWSMGLNILNRFVLCAPGIVGDRVGWVPCIKHPLEELCLLVSKQYFLPALDDHASRLEGIITAVRLENASLFKQIEANLSATRTKSYQNPRLKLRLLGSWILSLEVQTRRYALAWMSSPHLSGRTRVYRVRPRNSSIFLACQAADIPRVQALLGNGEASLFDVDEDCQGCLALLGHKGQQFSRQSDALLELLLAIGCDPNQLLDPMGLGHFFAVTGTPKFLFKYGMDAEGTLTDSLYRAIFHHPSFSLRDRLVFENTSLLLVPTCLHGGRDAASPFTLFRRETLNVRNREDHAGITGPDDQHVVPSLWMIARSAFDQKTTAWRAS